MYYQAGDTISDQFHVSNPATAGLVDADEMPTGVLVINGSNSPATVTITKLGTGLYKFSVVLPTLTGDPITLSVRIAATVGGVDAGGTVWKGTGRPMTTVRFRGAWGAYSAGQQVAVPALDASRMIAAGIATEVT